MKIAFVVRSDADSKPGGDTVQIGAYVNGLRAHGWQCRVVHPADVRALDRSFFVHVVNTARPYEFLGVCEALRGRPYAVSPIHHSLRDVRRMRREAIGSGLPAVIDRHATEATRELLATVGRRSRASTGDDTGAVSLLRRRYGLWRRVGRALDEAVFVQVLSSSERTSLMYDTGWHGTNARLVPNGRPTLPAGYARPDRDRPTDILQVGRIEPRKRQLEVARAASRVHARVRFVGDLNPNFPEYGRAFEQAVASSGGLTWAGSCSHEEALVEMSNARVLINPSFAEVQSLVDIEAASLGCQILTSATGSSFEYMPGVSVFSHDDLTGMLLAARAAARSFGTSEKLSYPYTWDDAVDALCNAYLASGAARQSGAANSVGVAHFHADKSTPSIASVRSTSSR